MSQATRKQVIVADATPARMVLAELFTRLGFEVVAIDDAKALSAEVEKRTRPRSPAALAAPRMAPVDLLVVDLRLVHTAPAETVIAFREAGLDCGILLIGEPNPTRPRAVRPIGDRALVSEGAPLSELVFAATEMLFPHKEELRRYERVFGGFPVLYLAGDRWLKGEIYNLSRDGAFIETQSPQPVGSALRIKFHLPQARETIELRGRVTRVSPPTPGGTPPGMGLKFTHLTRRDEDSLTRFVTARRAR